MFNNQNFINFIFYKLKNNFHTTSKRCYCTGSEKAASLYYK